MVRNITGSTDHYGSYYSPDVSIYHLPPAWEAKTVLFTGRLVENLVEGRHLELKTDGQGVLVVIPANPQVAAELEKYVGREVIVEGILERKPNIYMRGPLLRVMAVKPHL